MAVNFTLFRKHESLAPVYTTCQWTIHELPVAIIAVLPAHRPLAWLPFKHFLQQNFNFKYQFYVLTVIEPTRNLTRIFFFLNLCLYGLHLLFFILCG